MRLRWSSACSTSRPSCGTGCIGEGSLPKLHSSAACRALRAAHAKAGRRRILQAGATACSAGHLLPAKDPPTLS